jgi:triphosphoribosyl-dephospho-CoA synthetase
MRRVSFLAAAWLALIGAGLSASAVYAAPAAEWQPNDDDALLLALRSGNYRVGDAMRGYQTPRGVCVDLADLIQALDLPVRLDKKSRRATGWLFAETRRSSSIASRIRYKP